MGLTFKVNYISHDASYTSGHTTLTGLLLRCDAAVAVGGQNERWGADAVVRVLSVHTVAVLAVGRILAFIHTCEDGQ